MHPLKKLKFLTDKDAILLSSVDDISGLICPAVSKGGDEGMVYYTTKYYAKLLALLFSLCRYP